jgi:hypothetical protein
MSFPILCIANAAVIFAVKEWNPEHMISCEEQDQDVHERFPLRVNGDDAIFITNKAEFSLWSDVTKDCGLAKSPGKNYLSRDFALMNSELRVKSGSEGRRFEYKGYINQSLLRGRVRKGVNAGADFNIPWPLLATHQRKLIRGFSPEEACVLTRLFIAFHKDCLGDVPSNCSYWLPLSLGGVGMSCPWDVVDTTTKEHMRLELSCASNLRDWPERRLERPSLVVKEGLVKKATKERKVPRIMVLKDFNPVANSTPVVVGSVMTHTEEIRCGKTNFGEQKPEELSMTKANMHSSNHAFNRRWLEWTEDLFDLGNPQMMSLGEALAYTDPLKYMDPPSNLCMRGSLVPAITVRPGKELPSFAAERLLRE